MLSPKPMLPPATTPSMKHGRKGMSAFVTPIVSIAAWISDGL
jgi:hypothetical protein